LDNDIIYAGSLLHNQTGGGIYQYPLFIMGNLRYSTEYCLFFPEQKLKKNKLLNFLRSSAIEI
jgi:hypothetical protein